MRISDWSSDVCSSDLIDPTGKSMDNPARTAEKSEIDCMTGDTSMGQQVGSGSDGIRHTTGWGWILAYGVIVFLVGLLALFNPLATGMATGLRSEEHTSELQSLMRIS